MKIWVDWDDEMLNAIIRIIKQWEDNLKPEECNFCGHPDYISWIEKKIKVIKMPWYKRLLYLVKGI